ncbi:MAG TPA: undecaprenyl-diphosphate phosphatase [Chitinophagales bacterium]|nr:undecaprenyl-diphosphate phosphatase [Chitinophagales bacterium]HRH53799.1 undecaprenyl-diphosphate phosphatase [Chitinophagales bacterium]
MTILEAVVLAIVEGITEFLPVSSTGHMIIASSLMGISHDEFTKSFTVAIQFGAILSVVVLYWKRFFKSINFYFKLFVGFIPAAILGFLLGDYIDAMLENVTVVAIALIAGGVVLLFVDRLFGADITGDVSTTDHIGYKNAFVIGVFQCIAMIPGVSRSAATIIGGLTQKLTRKVAAEFSFFLAVPTMFAATGYKLYTLYSDGPGFTSDDYMPLIIGNVVAFIIAIFAMRSFVNYLTKHGFKIFGYYRIIVGTIILVLLALGVDLQIV